MRRNHVATVLVVLTAGLTATAAVRRLAGRRRRPVAAQVVAAPAGGPVVDRDAVVLAFTPRVARTPAPEQPAAASRCGDHGGRTKAGAPCGARATGAGRCHHHRLAA